MKLENILIEKNEHTAILTINRPPANSWNLDAIEDYAKALDNVENDRNIRVGIITGAGENAVLRSMSAGIYEGMYVGLDMETEMSGMVGQTRTAAECFCAFIEKRNPVFLGE